jgi:hypothetical protein
MCQKKGRWIPVTLTGNCTAKSLELALRLDESSWCSELVYMRGWDALS